MKLRNESATERLAREKMESWRIEKALRPAMENEAKSIMEEEATPTHKPLALIMLL